MGNGSAEFANNVKHLTLTTFCSYFTSLINHENPFSLLLLVLFNNNEIEEQNQTKNIKSLLYLVKTLFWFCQFAAHLRFKVPRAHNLMLQQ